MGKKQTRVLIFLGIILFATFLIIFLWKEHLSFTEKINDQKVTNFILIFASTVTSISILLLWKQLEEQRLSRLNSVLPDIFPEDLTCVLSEGEHEIGGLKGIHIYPKDSSPILVNIYNIGIGSAKEIQTQWIYNISEVDYLIKGKYSYFTPMDRGDSDYISFLKPNENRTISLPLYYILCCGPKLNLKSHRSGSDGKFGIKPNLKLKISYSDLNNRKFEKSFNVAVNAYSEDLYFKFKQP